MLVIVVVATVGGELRQFKGIAKEMYAKINEQQVQKYILRYEGPIGIRIQNKIYHFSNLLFKSTIAAARIRHT